MSRLIILDRDGVINRDSDHFIKTVDEFMPLPGSLQAIARLCQADYSVMVATNQSGIARQLFSLDTLHAMHDKLQTLLSPLGGKISGFYFCPHGPDDHCDCRKPKPGLILQIAEDFFGSDAVLENALSRVFVIGDSLRDLQAGRAAGAQVALVRTGKGECSLARIAEDNLLDYQSLPVYTDLADFTRQLLNNSQ